MLRSLTQRLLGLTFRPGCDHHNRGLASFDEIVTGAGLPDLATQIEGCLVARGRCKLLEIGCGEGRLLLEILAHFGRRVELHGLNHTGWRILRGGRAALPRTNARYQLMPPARLRSLPLPDIHFGDVQHLRRFPHADFDLIVSQWVLIHVNNKARALEETARLLAPDGTFIHDLDRADLPRADFLDEDLPRFTIYDGGRRVSTTAYLDAHGVEVRRYRPRQVTGTIAVYRRSRGALQLRLGIDEASSFYLKKIAGKTPATSFWGARSVYRTR